MIDFSVSDTSVYVLIPRSGGRLNGKRFYISEYVTAQLGSFM